MTNKEVVIRFYEIAFGEKDAVKSSLLLTEDFIHNGEKKGRDGQTQVVKYFNNAFPDMFHTIDMIFAEGKYVTARQSWSGTHKGEFGGVQPTGKVITFDSTAILKVENELIAEAWDCFDMYGIYKQMGELPL